MSQRLPTGLAVDAAMRTTFSGDADLAGRFAGFNAAGICSCQRMSRPSEHTLSRGGLEKY